MRYTIKDDLEQYGKFFLDFRFHHRIQTSTSMGGKKSKVDPTGFIRDCPNGRLDKKKFLEVYEQFCPGGNAKNYCKYAFDAFDKNDDGTIDFSEFLLSFVATKGGDVDERLSAAFDLYDISDDEQVDQKELVKMITAIYELNGVADHGGHNNPKTRAAEIIASLDVNGDRKLSKHEFIAGCKNDPYIRQILAPNA
ncbi:unnamed protein product [Rotaria sp. Silwood1]|nr:unnamed protein product [Rotaria sp. Silwood1]CAF4707032.1 unnamed protein product [Rotaria sp. Silwood1]